MGNRRGFLKMSASLAAAPLIPESTAVSNELDIPVSNKRPHELARDEAHWRAVGSRP